MGEEDFDQILDHRTLTRARMFLEQGDWPGFERFHEARSWFVQDEIERHVAKHVDSRVLRYLTENLPDNSLAIRISARDAIERAWEIRGSDWAQNTPKEALRQHRELIQDLRDRLDPLVRDPDVHPGIVDAWLTCMMASSSNVDVPVAVVNRTLERYPERSRLLGELATGVLCPKWSGLDWSTYTQYIHQLYEINRDDVPGAYRVHLAARVELRCDGPMTIEDMRESIDTVRYWRDQLLSTKHDWDSLDFVLALNELSFDFLRMIKMRESWDLLELADMKITYWPWGEFFHTREQVLPQLQKYMDYDRQT